MKSTIRKSTSLLNIEYHNGNYTNNLFGSFFTLDSSEESNVLGIDFSSNFRTRNKQENSYHDAVELSKEYEDLRSLSIHEKKVNEYIIKAHKTNPSAPWTLELNLNSPETVSLPIKEILVLQR